MIKAFLLVNKLSIFNCTLFRLNHFDEINMFLRKKTSNKESLSSLLEVIDNIVPFL